MSILRRMVASVGALACLLAALPAIADESRCAEAYEQTQLLRRRGKILEARRAAEVCAKPTCPEVARKDCAGWAAQLTSDVATLIVITREAGTGNDAEARVQVDGVVRPEVSAGRAIELDPGAHVLRVERPGDEPVTQSIILVQGEKARIVRVDLHRVDPSLSRAPGGEPLGSSPAGPARTFVPAVIVSGVALAAVATSVGFGVSGRADLAHLRATCAPACTDDAVDPVRRKLIVSDVALAAGIVGSLAAIYLVVRPPASSSATTTRLEVTPTVGGGAITMRITF